MTLTRLDKVTIISVKAVVNKSGDDCEAHVAEGNQ